MKPPLKPTGNIFIGCFIVTYNKEKRHFTILPYAPGFSVLAHSFGPLSRNEGALILSDFQTPRMEAWVAEQHEL